MSSHLVKAYGPDAFVTTWKTDNAGTSNSTSITIPTSGTGQSYSVDWNCDDTIDQTGITGVITHNYGVAGTYQVCITGDIKRFQFSNAGDKLKLLSVDQWGAPVWDTMYGSFWGASNMDVLATDTPNLSNVTNTRYMFRGASSMVGNSSFDTWDMSNVTSGDSMFMDATLFNAPIGSWNVSKFTSFLYLFRGAQAFNQPIGNWNTSNVTDMRYVFYDATAFNQPLNNWDTSKAKLFTRMFGRAFAFNQPLDQWNTSSATDMSYMFLMQIFSTSRLIHGIQAV